MRLLVVLALFWLGSSASRGHAQNADVLERARIDLRLHEISDVREELTLGGPIALMATGFGATALLAASDFLLWAIMKSVSAGEGESLSHGDRRLFRSLGVAAASTALVGTGGVAWMIMRVRDRRDCDRETQSLLQRRMQLAPTVGARGVGFQLSATF